MTSCAAFCRLRLFDSLEMLCMVKVSREARQPRETLQRRVRRVKTFRLMADGANRIDGRSSVGRSELHQMATGAIPVHRKSRLRRRIGSTVTRSTFVASHELRVFSRTRVLESRVVRDRCGWRGRQRSNTCGLLSKCFGFLLLPEPDTNARHDQRYPWNAAAEKLDDTLTRRCLILSLL